MKSREKSWQVRENWSQQFEHKQVPKCGTEPGGRKFSVPCWHATPVANASWKPLVIRWRSSSVSRSWYWWKNWLVGDVTVIGQGSEMSFNIRGRETSYCQRRSRIDHKTFLRTISSVPTCLFEISDVLITCLNSCPNLIQLTSWVSCFKVLQKTLLKMCMQLCEDKKEEIWPSPMTKAPIPTEMSKGQSSNTNNATKKFD